MSRRDEIVFLWGPWLTALLMFVFWGKFDAMSEMMPLVLILSASIAGIPHLVLVLLMGGDSVREYIAVLLILVLGTAISTVNRQQYMEPRVISYFFMGSYILAGPAIWYLISGVFKTAWFNKLCENKRKTA